MDFVMLGIIMIFFTVTTRLTFLPCQTLEEATMTAWYVTGGVLSLACSCIS